MAPRGYVLPSRTSPNGHDSSMSWRGIDIADPNDRSYLNTAVSVGKHTSNDAWEWYEKIGEVHYGISRSSRIAGYARLRAEKVGRDGQIENVADAGVVADIVDSIYSRFGGVRGLIERFYHLMKLPAEGYLVRVRDKPGADPDGYFFLSPSELDSAQVGHGLPMKAAAPPDDPIRWVTAKYAGNADGETSEYVRKVERQDFLGRIWTPSKQWVDMVDTPMTALADECNALHLLTQNIIGRLRQRFALAGVILIPSEINDANISGPLPTQAVHADKVLNYFIAAMDRNATGHSEGKGQMPILLKGPAEALAAFRHVIFDTMVAETDIKLRTELIGRILDGLDVQKQATAGMAETNHWNAWQISDEERRITVQPDLETMCFALTRAILHVELKARGWNDARIRPWRVGYELSAASVKSNMAEDVRQGWDRGWVNMAAARVAIGMTENDAMSAEEYVRWVGVKLQDPFLALFGLDGIEVALEHAKVAASPPKPPGPNPDSPGDDQPVGPGVGQPGSPDDRDSDAPKSEEPTV